MVSELLISLDLFYNIIRFTWSIIFQLKCDSVVTAISAGPGTLNFKINRELLTKVRVDDGLLSPFSHTALPALTSHLRTCAQDALVCSAVQVNLAFFLPLFFGGGGISSV